MQENSKPRELARNNYSGNNTFKGVLEHCADGCCLGRLIQVLSGEYHENGVFPRITNDR